MSAVSESNNQVNFNPAWMQSLRPDKPNIRSSVDSDDSNKMDSAPVFAVHRYGREDILALIPQSTRPPDGLKASQFFVETPLEPIILTPLNEIEQRCQQNINSSKALSLVNHTSTRNGTPSQPTSPWTVAGGTKTKSTPTTNSRWQHLTSGDSPSTGYVKPGTGRGGAVGGLGRGGGLAGSGSGRTIVRNPPEGKSGFAAGSRTRYKSTSEDDAATNAANNGWTVVGGKGGSHEPAEQHAWRSGRGDSEQPVTIDRFDASELNGTFSRSNSNRATAAPVNPGASQSARGSRGDAASSRFDDSTASDWDPLGSKNLVEHHSPPLNYANADPYAAYLRQPSNLASSAPEPPSQERDLSNITNILENTSLSASTDYWCYLDPNGSQHGPYEGVQMLIWYKSGFFRNDLRCRKAQTEAFITLGELIQKNGSENPFVFAQPPVPQPPIGFSSSVGNRSPWAPTRSSEAQKIMESQQALLEERRRLEEQQERLRREEQERIDKERALRELENELQRRQAELHRMATAREQELEQKRREIADFERMQRLEAENRLMEKRRAEELEVRRQQEEVERNRQLLEEQQRQQAEELRRQQEEAQAEAERVREQARLEARQLEEQRKQHKAAQAEAERREAEKRLEMARQLLQNEAKRRREAEEAAHAAEQARIAAAKAAAASKVAPWSTTAAVKKENPQLQTQRSLLEIQLEEERALEERRKLEAEALEQQKKTSGNTKSAKPWAATAAAGTTKAPWNETSSRGSPVAAKTPTAAANSSWPPIPSASPQFAKKPEPKPAPKAAAAPVVTSPKNKKTPEKDGVNVFQKWIIDAIKKLNKNVGTTVDADTFSIFIETIENPDEVEDYFLSYFGETDAVKEFHQEFLEKRIQLRPRNKVSAKDDLSAAQSAVNATKITSDFQTVKKKGKGKGKGAVKTVDLTVLSFKPSSDPNRFNAGEIDTAPPMPSKKKR
uniref:GYF domain-containing protein n=1 Tax=Panagrellus redivivus TaxID=6233 RepID=A0A7E4VBX7_PANRE